MKDITLRATCRCRECDGTGYLENHMWVKFHDANEAWQEIHPRPISTHAAPVDAWYGDLEQFEEKWWADQGYSLRNLPPEEYPCPTCNGTGTEVFNLTLQELAELLEEHTHA